MSNDLSEVVKKFANWLQTAPKEDVQRWRDKLAAENKARAEMKRAMTIGRHPNGAYYIEINGQELYGTNTCGSRQLCLEYIEALYSPEARDEEKVKLEKEYGPE